MKIIQAKQIQKTVNFYHQKKGNNLKKNAHQQLWKLTGDKKYKNKNKITQIIHKYESYFWFWKAKTTIKKIQKINKSNPVWPTLIEQFLCSLIWIHVTFLKGQENISIRMDPNNFFDMFNSFAYLCRNIQWAPIIHCKPRRSHQQKTQSSVYIYTYNIYIYTSMHYMSSNKGKIFGKFKNNPVEKIKTLGKFKNNPEEKIKSWGDLRRG